MRFIAQILFLNLAAATETTTEPSASKVNSSDFEHPQARR